MKYKRETETLREVERGGGRMTEEERREKWNEMKSQDPTLANLLMRARKELGAEVKRMVWKGEVVIDGGSNGKR